MFNLLALLVPLFLAQVGPTPVPTAGPAAPPTPIPTAVPTATPVNGATLKNVGVGLNIFNVVDNGAVHDAITSDDAAITATITAATPSCGNVYFPAGRYYTTGTFNLPQCVSMVGANVARYIDVPQGPTPAVTTYGATLLVTAGAGNAGGTPFIGLNGHSNVSGLIFYYPNQVANTVATPIAYPWTIQMQPSTNMGNSVAHNEIVNGYQCIQTHAGRTHVMSNKLGCYLTDVLVDGSADLSYVQDNIFWPEWDFLANGNPSATAVDTFVNANRTNILINFANGGIYTGNFGIFGHIGFDIRSAGASGDNAWGQITSNYIEGLGIAMRFNSGIYTLANNYITGSTPTSSIPIEIDAPPVGYAAASVTETGDYWGQNAPPVLTAGLAAGAIYRPSSITNYAQSKFGNAQFDFSQVQSPVTNAATVGVDSNGAFNFKAYNLNGFRFLNDQTGTATPGAIAGTPWLTVDNSGTTVATNLRKSTGNVYPYIAALGGTSQHIEIANQSTSVVFTFTTPFTTAFVCTATAVGANQSIYIVTSSGTAVTFGSSPAIGAHMMCIGS